MWRHTTPTTSHALDVHNNTIGTMANGLDDLVLLVNDELGASHHSLLDRLLVLWVPSVAGRAVGLLGLARHGEQLAWPNNSDETPTAEHHNPCTHNQPCCAHGTRHAQRDTETASTHATQAPTTQNHMPTHVQEHTQHSGNVTDLEQLNAVNERDCVQVGLGENSEFPSNPQKTKYDDQMSTIASCIINRPRRRVP